MVGSKHGSEAAGLDDTVRSESAPTYSDPIFYFRAPLAPGACPPYIRSMNLKFAGAFVAHLRAGRTGDAAAMKAAMFGARAYPEIAEKLRLLRAPFPAIDLEALRALPESSFGQQYAAFLDRNRLRPFQVSPEVAEELWPEHVLEVRYPLLHDAFHVLLDFDISLAGELGVWSFVAAQHYSPAYDRAGRLGARFYPLIAPRRRTVLAAAAERGRALGERAACLIAEPLELYWPEQIEHVREELGLFEAGSQSVSVNTSPGTP